VGLQAKGKGDLIWDLTEDEVRSAFRYRHRLRKKRRQPVKVIHWIACRPTGR
jgi:hypothetical protein